MRHKSSVNLVRHLLGSDDPAGRSGRRRLLRITAAAAAGGLVLAIVAGCTSGTSVSAASSASSGAAVRGGVDSPAQAGVPAAGSSGSPAQAGVPAAGSSGAASSAPAAAPTAAAGKGDSSAGGNKLPNIGAGVDAADRQVIRTANVTLNVVVVSTNTGAADDQKAEQDAVDAALTRVRDIPSGAGYVSAAEGRGLTQSITLRVPADGYNSAMDLLVGIAPIVSRQETTQDVTSQMIDITSRMETMTASVNRVRALLSKADKIGDVIAIESELTSREADLESLQRQQAALSGQTSLSTITVVVQGSITGVKPIVKPKPPAPPAARSGFLGGLANGWDAVRKLVHGGLTVVGTLIPFLPLVLILVIGAVIWRRRVRRAVPPTLATPDAHPVD
jgi:hypothetical protein